MRSYLLQLPFPNVEIVSPYTVPVYDTMCTWEMSRWSIRILSLFIKSRLFSVLRSKGCLSLTPSSEMFWGIIAYGKLLLYMYVGRKTREFLFNSFSVVVNRCRWILFEILKQTVNFIFFLYVCTLIYCLTVMFLLDHSNNVSVHSFGFVTCTIALFTNNDRLFDTFQLL